MEKPPLQPIGFIDNVPPAPSFPDEVSPESQTDPVVDFSKIPPLPLSALRADVQERGEDEVLPTDIVHASDSEVSKKEQEPLSPEAEKFYNDEYQRVRTIIVAYVAEHEDEFEALNHAESRFVKTHFKSSMDARAYVLHHVCCGSSPEPKDLRYLDTEESDFYHLIKTHTGIDVYATDEEEEEENQ
jgi:hypothetical protein